VAKCSICQQVKVKHRKPAGLLQLLPIPEWKWKMITMDFVSRLLRGKRGNDAIWVIVDRLTKSALFLPVKMTDPVDKLAKISVLPRVLTFQRDQSQLKWSFRTLDIVKNLMSVQIVTIGNWTVTVQSQTVTVGKVKQ